MIANTKQIRRVINSAIKDIGTKPYRTWTDGGDRRIGDTRYVCYQIPGNTVEDVAAQTRILAEQFGYTNEIRVTDSNDRVPTNFRSRGHYIRVTTSIS